MSAVPSEQGVPASSDDRILNDVLVQVLMGFGILTGAAIAVITIYFHIGSAADLIIGGAVTLALWQGLDVLMEVAVDGRDGLRPHWQWLSSVIKVPLSSGAIGFTISAAAARGHGTAAFIAAALVLTVPYGLVRLRASRHNSSAARSQSVPAAPPPS